MQQHLFYCYIAPTAVLFFPTTTHTTIMSTTHNTLQQNNISTIGGSGGSAGSTFGVYQQTAVGLSDLLILRFDLLFLIELALSLIAKR